MRTLRERLAARNAARKPIEVVPAWIADKTRVLAEAEDRRSAMQADGMSPGVGSMLRPWHERHNEQRQCAVCGSLFRAMAPLHRYCSPSCSAIAASRRRRERPRRGRTRWKQTAECRICGSFFVLTRGRGTTMRVCPECYDRRRQCAFCGKGFVPPFKRGHGAEKYCSRRCAKRMEYRRKRNRRMVERARLRLEARRRRRCDRCGMSFIPGKAGEAWCLECASLNDARQNEHRGSGLNCTACGHETVVIDSRPINGGVRRRRKCPTCNTRFTTRECMVEVPADKTRVPKMRSGKRT